LNEKKVPQLFVASGAEELGDPKALYWLEEVLRLGINRRLVDLAQLLARSGYAH